MTITALAADIGRAQAKRVRELLARCLRLEAEAQALRLERAAPPRRRRIVTEADALQMRGLRRQGWTCVAIARETGWAAQTVVKHTKG